MLAKTILKPKEVMQVFQRKLNDQCDNDGANLNTVISGDNLVESSFHSLKAIAQSKKKITIGEVLDMLIECDEDDIDWRRLCTHLVCDMNDFSTSNENYHSNARLFSKRVESDPWFARLSKDTRDLGALNNETYRNLLALIPKPELAFHGFLLTEPEAWDIFFDTDQKKHIENCLGIYRDRSGFTIANLIEILFFAKKYLDYDVNFEHIYNALKAPHCDTCSVTSPLHVSTHDDRIFLPEKPTDLARDPLPSIALSEPLSTEKSRGSVLSDEAIHLLSVDLWDVCKSGCEYPTNTLDLLDIKTLPEIVNLSRLSIANKLIGLKLEKGDGTATQRIIQALKEDKKSVILASFENFKPFLESRKLEQLHNKNQCTLLTEECIDEISAALGSQTQCERKNFLSMLFKLGMKFDECFGLIDNDSCYGEPNNVKALIRGWKNAHPEVATKEMLIAGLKDIERYDVVDQINAYYHDSEKSQNSSNVPLANPFITPLAKYIASCYMLIANTICGKNRDTLDKILAIENKDTSNEQKAEAMLLVLMDEGTVKLTCQDDLENLKLFFSSFQQTTTPTQRYNETNALKELLTKIPEDIPMEDGCVICNENKPNTAYICCGYVTCKHCLIDAFKLKSKCCYNCREPLDTQKIGPCRYQTAKDADSN
jgi:hypothetical protein